VRKPFSPLDLLAVVQRVSGMGQVPARPARDVTSSEEELVLYARDLRHLLEVERAQRALLQQSYLATVTSLASALESRDTHTGAHSQRVQRYAIDLLDLIDPGRVERDPGVRYGFLLHDIGKMGVPDHILRKPSPLTREEWEVMQTHPLIGAQILAPIAYLQRAIPIVECHHERWDGEGYPRGLKGEEIPLAARIFAVVDTFDAMTSDRPYRRALTVEEAVAEIRAAGGTQLDPAIAEEFAQLCLERRAVWPIEDPGHPHD
jgi:ribonuclease P protein subunit RPR2